MDNLLQRAEKIAADAEKLSLAIKSAYETPSLEASDPQSVVLDIMSLSLKNQDVIEIAIYVHPYLKTIYVAAFPHGTNGQVDPLYKSYLHPENPEELNTLYRCKEILIELIAEARRSAEVVK
ncbi:TPA: hypothetical protein ACX6RY_002595 [Photobacterium damselae]